MQPLDLNAASSPMLATVLHSISQSEGCEMILKQMKAKDYAKAVGVGIGTGVLLSLIMVPAARVGI
jgi:hypothetical protein